MPHRHRHLATKVATGTSDVVGLAPQHHPDRAAACRKHAHDENCEATSQPPNGAAMHPMAALPETAQGQAVNRLDLQVLNRQVLLELRGLAELFVVLTVDLVMHTLTFHSGCNSMLCHSRGLLTQGLAGLTARIGRIDEQLLTVVQVLSRQVLRELRGIAELIVVLTVDLVMHTLTFHSSCYSMLCHSLGLLTLGLAGLTAQLGRIDEQLLTVVQCSTINRQVQRTQP
mmetsp:Transcript_27903/g.92689  ORF Transcript_27903/g.92689 Transcript_27903/m.92689 type:complete len:228 (-) Transcript_27903:177-860(-)